MKKTRVLYISQEITPHLPESPISKMGRYLPQGIQEGGKEIRTFMPRYGCINERRHQLHEVIRLSGMNLIIDDADHPLIIKVASIPAAKMQVYFIDNEEYFKRKAVLSDAEGKFFDDNDERSIFFCRGVLETIKKLGWAPDIIHCHGWMTSMVPLYLKKAFANDPIFADTKVVYSVYNDKFENELSGNYSAKAKFENITDEDVVTAKCATHENVQKLGIEYSDAIIVGEETINDNIASYIESTGKPVLGYKTEEEYIEAYSSFYDEILEEAGVLVE